MNKILLSGGIFSLLFIFIYFFFGDWVVYHADFQLSAQFSQEVYKCFYTWSEVSNGVNLDGVMRFFTRIPNLLFFGVFQSNVLLSYFYIAFALGTAFASFFFFLKHFVKIPYSFLLWGLSFVYVLNPVFLGNISKIGLVFSASLLPIMLVFIQKSFENKNFSLLFWVLLCFFFSFIHPFTAVINLGVVAVYFLYKSVQNWNTVVQNIWSILVWVMLAVGMSSFMLFTLLSTGSVDKSVLGNSLGAPSAGEMSLLDVANTKSLWEAFSFSKSVLKDYDFYSPLTEWVYFALVLVVVGSVVVASVLVLLRTKNLMGWVMLGVFVVLGVLSTGGEFMVGRWLNTLLMENPLGWIFRSPLKWQLYIPFVFTGLCAVVFYFWFALPKNSAVWKRNVWMVFLGFWGIISTYILFEISTKLLVPKDISQEKEMLQSVPQGSRFLYLNTPECALVSQSKEKILFVLQSHGFSVTALNNSEYTKENFFHTSFDFVISCTQSLDTDSSFRVFHTLNNEVFIYQSIDPSPLPRVSPYTVFVNSLENIDYKNRFITDILLGGKEGLLGIPSSHSDLNSDLDFNHTVVSLPFQDTDDFRGDTKQGNIQLDIDSGPIQLYQSESLHHVRKSVRYIEKDEAVEFSFSDVSPQTVIRSSNKKPLVFQTEAETENQSFLIPKASHQEVFVMQNNIGSFVSDNADAMRKIDASFPFEVFFLSAQNRIQNPSFEHSLWTPTVQDCYNYDDDPKISMGVASYASEGSRSLRLDAQRHNACTVQSILVEEEQLYIFSFDYNFLNAFKGGYSLTFNDEQSTMVKEFFPQSNTWESFSKRITVPKGATEAKLYLYSYADREDSETFYTALYDNFAFKKVEHATVLNFATQEEREKGFVVSEHINSVDQEKLVFSFDQYPLTNMLPNGSFRDGNWYKTVEDCYNYDDNADVDMELLGTEDRGHFLELSGTNHTACTHTVVDIIPERFYMLRFDANLSKGRPTHVSLRFDDAKRTLFRYKLFPAEDWENHSFTFQSPVGATQGVLRFYAPSSKENDTEYIYWYDNVELIEVPDLAHSYVLVHNPEGVSSSFFPSPVIQSYQNISPVESKVLLSGVSETVFLEMPQGYHRAWSMCLFDTDVCLSSDHHFSSVLNSNIWRIDPQQLCVPTSGKNPCIQNPQGGYDILLVQYFTTQTYFLYGLFLSIVSMVLGGVFFVYLRNKKNKATYAHESQNTP